MPETKKENLPRLNKYVAAAAKVARRKADELIFAGRVTINGEICREPGRRVENGDQVTLDSKVLAPPASRVYIILNKPVGYVCTRDDPQGRDTIFDLLPKKYRDAGLFYAGRLDYFSEGLLILTNDGDLAQRLTHPRHCLEKTYAVATREPFNEDMTKEAAKGMALSDGTRLAPVAVNISPRDSRRATMRLMQGLNREIRRMCEKWGLTVLKLKRVRQGGVELGDLPAGKTRELTETEKAALFKLAYANDRDK